MLTLIQDLGMQYASIHSKRKRRFGIFKCHCGNEFKTETSKINNNKIKTCGKCSQENSVFMYHQLKRKWLDIKKRTINIKSADYKNYGGRGITICDEWLNDFMSFYDWSMNNGYSEGLSIDRINNDGNYEPSNCRWATCTVQQRNKRKIIITNTSGYRGVSYNKKTNRWIAQIQVDGVQKYLGSFDNPLGAANQYDKYVSDHNLEHTKNNVV